jgi:hypothetical protein
MLNCYLILPLLQTKLEYLSFKFVSNFWQELTKVKFIMLYLTHPRLIRIASDEDCNLGLAQVLVLNFYLILQLLQNKL